MPQPISSVLEASFYVTGGTLPPNAPSYVERQADHDLHAALCAGETCYVLNSRQMGKSSLCVRTLQRLKQGGYRTAFLDLTKFGGRNLTAEQWYAALLSEVGRELSLRSEFLTYWKENGLLPPVQRLFGAITEIGIAADRSPLVIFIDEIDVTRSLPFSADEFFAAIRQVYVGRSTTPTLARIAFCLLGTATPAELIQDTRVSPFNIGKRILLQDFTDAEAAPLAQGMAQGKPVLKRILYWTGGHPYLTQRLCRAIAEEPHAGTIAEVDRLCNELFLTHRAKEADDNLAFVRNRLLKSEAELAALLELYGRMRAGKRVPDDETNPLCAVVKLSGVARTEAGLLKVRNRIYAHVFDRTWVVTHLPDAERRRQHQAFLKGLGLAGAVFGTVLSVIITLAGIALNEKHQLQATLKRAVAGERTAKENERRAEEASRKSNASELEATRQKKIAVQKQLDADHEKRRAEWQRQQADKERLLAQVAARNSDRQEHLAISAKQSESRQRESSAQSLYAADMQLAGHLWEEGNSAKVAELLEQHRPSAHNPKDRRGFAWRYQWTLLHSAPVFRVHSWVVLAGAFAEDGTLLTMDGERHLRRWDIRTQRPIPQKDVFATAKWISPDGKTLALLQDDRTQTLTLWDLTSGRERSLPYSHGTKVKTGGFSPNSRWLYLIDLDNTVTVWDVAAGIPVHRRAELENSENTFARNIFALAPNGQTLAALDQDGFAPVLYDLTRTAPAPQSMNGRRHNATVESLAFSPDGEHLATGDYNGNVIVWNCATRNTEHRLSPARLSMATALLFAPDGKTLAVGRMDGLVQIWDIRHETPLRSLAAHTARIFMLAYNALGSELLTGSLDGEARLWELDKIPGERILPPSGTMTVRAACSPDGSLLATNGHAAVTLWDTRTWKNVGSLSNGSAPTAVAFSPDSRLLAVGLEDKRVVLWDVQTRQVRHIFSDFVISRTSQGFGPWSLAFSPDGRYLAAGDGLGISFASTLRCELKIWDLRTERLVKTIPYQTPLTALAFSPDGRQLASGGQDNQVKLWHVGDWKPIYAIQGPDTGAGYKIGTGLDIGVYSLAFAPDSRTLAVGGYAGGILLVDPINGRPRFSLSGHTNIVWGLDFARDGSTLVSASLDRTVRCWDLASRRETQKFTDHTDAVLVCLFLPQGNALVTGSQSGDFIVHEAVSLQEADARDRVTRRYHQEVQARRNLARNIQKEN